MLIFPLEQPVGLHISLLEPLNLTCLGVWMPKPNPHIEYRCCEVTAGIAQTVASAVGYQRKRLRANKLSLRNGSFCYVTDSSIAHRVWARMEVRKELAGRCVQVMIYTRSKGKVTPSRMSDLVGLRLFFSFRFTLFHTDQRRKVSFQIIVCFGSSRAVSCLF